MLHWLENNHLIIYNKCINYKTYVPTSWIHPVWVCGPPAVLQAVDPYVQDLDMEDGLQDFWVRQVEEDAEKRKIYQPEMISPQRSLSYSGTEVVWLFKMIWYGMVWSLWWASSKSQNHFVLSIFISSWRISSWVELQTCISGSSTNLSFMIHMLVRGYNFGWLISCQKLLDVHLQFIYLFVLFVWA